MQKRTLPDSLHLGIRRQGLWLRRIVVLNPSDGPVQQSDRGFDLTGPHYDR